MLSIIFLPIHFLTACVRTLIPHSWIHSLSVNILSSVCREEIKKTSLWVQKNKWKYKVDPSMVEGVLFCRGLKGNISVCSVWHRQMSSLMMTANGLVPFWSCFFLLWERFCHLWTVLKQRSFMSVQPNLPDVCTELTGGLNLLRHQCHFTLSRCTHRSDYCFHLCRAPKGGAGGVHGADAQSSYSEDQEEGGPDQDSPAGSRRRQRRSHHLSGLPLRGQRQLAASAAGWAAYPLIHLRPYSDHNWG